jgi:glycosyltransferase involved in cell wall biosynthesis
LRILIVPDVFPTRDQPGLGIFILRRVQALRDLGHELRVLRVVPFAPPFGNKWRSYSAIPAYDTVDGITVVTARAIIPPRMIGIEYAALQMRGRLEREIREFRPDLVHASFLVPCGQIAVRQRLVPAIVSAHGADAYRWPRTRAGLRRASQEAVREAAGVTAVSGYIAQCVRELVDRDVRVIWNGGDERFFYPRVRAESRAALGLPDAARIIAFAGNVLAQKGVFDLLCAVAALPEKQDVLVAIAGTGPDSEAFEQQARAAGVRVHMLGRLSSEQVASLFTAADLVTLPSHAEGLPNVVCEAMLAQCAVVATTVGGTPEIVEHGRTGLLVPPRDPAALSAALQSVLSSDDLQDRLARGAREFALANLTWRVSAKKYEAFYREILDASAPDPRATRRRIPSAVN